MVAIQFLSKALNGVLLSTYALAILTSAAAGQDAPPNNWIKTNAVAIDTVEAGHGFVDLEPLKTMIGDARIVSLGESTHGSREIFQMKHRLVEYLASELGFTIFSIEANMPEAYRLNEYVLGGDGDPVALIRGMYFWTWSTQEVLEMVQWMRRFNAEKKGHIEFTGFDMQTPDVAIEEVLRFLRKTDAAQLAQISPLYTQAVRARPMPAASFAVATGSFPVDVARGKRVNFAGWIRTENVRDGFAGLWWRSDGPDGKVLSFDNMAARQVAGSRDWERFSIELDVPAETVNINFGVIMPGKGRAWFDGLEVTLDGKAYVDAELFDFDFEGRAPKGIIPIPSGGHLGAIDNSVAKTGKQSLRLESIESRPGSIPAEEFQKIVAGCARVVGELEKARSDLADRSSVKEVDWAIQNARIVDQAMRQRAGDMLVRDASMADNVEWILNQNPGAKIVLWAHNGHVAKLPQAMGSYLDKKFGAKHITVGFATGSGEYQAMGNRGLSEHPLQSPPPGSIEAALQQAGPTRFVLDLRRAGSDPAAAAWFGQPRPFRSIGALAMDAQFFPMVVPKMFDAVIYLDKTTRARPMARN